MRHTIDQAVNAFVVINKNPRAEVLAVLQRPPNRIRRRASFAVNRQPPPQQRPTQQNPENNGGVKKNRRMSVADFRPNNGGQINIVSTAPTAQIAEPMDTSNGSNA